IPYSIPNASRVRAPLPVQLRPALFGVSLPAPKARFRSCPRSPPLSTSAAAPANRISSPPPSNASDWPLECPFASACTFECLSSPPSSALSRRTLSNKSPGSPLAARKPRIPAPPATPETCSARSQGCALFDAPDLNRRTCPQSPSSPRQDAFPVLPCVPAGPRRIAAQKNGDPLPSASRSRHSSIAPPSARKILHISGSLRTHAPRLASAALSIKVPAACASRTRRFLRTL